MRSFPKGSERIYGGGITEPSVTLLIVKDILF